MPSTTSFWISLLCASIMGMEALLNATVGGSILIGCSIPADTLSLRWFYWQEDHSSNMLFHWDTSRTTKPVADEYRDRCEVFNTEFSSGNISLRLNSVAVGDDQKTFCAFVGFYDKLKKFDKSEQMCTSTLQVSAPYQDLVLTVDKAANSATCTARGGYPKPQVSWRGLNKSSSVQLQDAQTSLLQDPMEQTFSVTSSVSVKELQSVTCLISNPRSNQSIGHTIEIHAPGEDQHRKHVVIAVCVVLAVLAVVPPLLYRQCQNSNQHPKPTENQSASAERNSSDAPPNMSGENCLTSGNQQRSTGNRYNCEDPAAAAAAEQEAILLSDRVEKADDTNTSESDRDK